MISEPNSRLARLRAGTRDAHAQIENVPALIRLMAPDLTRGEYVAILQHLHAFHTTLEPAVAAALEAYPEAAAMLDGHRPRALAEDLAWFDATTIAPPSLPLLDTPSAALGALYVIEGSGLGGRVIARHLTDSLGVSPGTGGSFYGMLSAEAARQRWQRLCAVLDEPKSAQPSVGVSQCPTDPIDTNLVVDGAYETFSSLDRFLRQISVALFNGPKVAEAVAP